MREYTKISCDLLAQFLRIKTFKWFHAECEFLKCQRTFGRKPMCPQTFEVFWGYIFRPVNYAEISCVLTEY
jgi:hypothetical protein